ncbi:MAG: hypothetical protein HY433_02800 [Candidatus Liptonbacteria bacterium]|nr:hypothetical protein [Candidatus Liptonbacteria bacterium]
MNRLSYLYNIFQAIFIFIDVALFCALIFAVFRGWKFRPKLAVSKPEENIVTLGNAAFKERWEEIAKKTESGSFEPLRIAIVDADKLADDILRRMGLGGKHIADRLEQLSQDDFTSLERLWRAHRVRNQLVHEPDFRISADEGAKTLKDYEAFLKETGTI